ncbi:MAG: tellurite resistance TerB family protein [Rhodobacteraceae bacterium]|nr:tellurite resistance TerB family protein [Paracoccaceae bacterium]
MSLVRTLAKIAIGLLVVKGVKGALERRGPGAAARPGTGTPWDGGRSAGDGGSALDDVPGEALGGPRGGARPAGGGGGPFEDELGRFGGGGAAGRSTGRATSAGPGGGGLGEILDSLGAGPSGRGGTIDDALGRLGRGGGLGDLLGAVLGSAAAAGAGAAPAPQGGAVTQGTKGFGEVLDEAFTQKGDVAAAPAHEAVAALLLRAMIQAAKADGRIDEAEKRRILDSLGEASAQEVAFVRQELAADIDVAGLARQVPEGLAVQVYGASVMAITLDSRQEAQYLHALADALGIAPADVNAIHARLGVRELYS